MLSKRMFRTLGLSVVAMMGLAAFFAGGAQAIAGSYQVLGSESLASDETFTGTGGLGVLLVATLNVEIHCGKYTVTSGKILSGPLGTALAIVLFEKCEVKSISPLETLTTCVISNGGANHHILATGIVLSILHNGTRYLLADEEATFGSSPFATIEWTKGIGCTLPNPVTVTGTYAFNTSQSQVTNPSVKPGNEALQTLLGDELKFGKNKSILDGEGGTVALTGDDKNCTWGAV